MASSVALRSASKGAIGSPAVSVAAAAGRVSVVVLSGVTQEC
jgi:hypothetical protein